MLYDPAAHEPLDASPWDAGRSNDEIDAIVAEAETTFDEHALWPHHPLDEEPDNPAEPYTALYHGAAGVVWALDELRRSAATSVPAGRDWAVTMRAVVAAHDAQPEAGAHTPGLLIGRSGVLAVAHRLAPTAALADELAALIAANAGDPTNELMWGEPGTLLVAQTLVERTNEARFEALRAACAERIWDAWDLDEARGCRLWTQDLYGRVQQMLGPAHGFAGNAWSLWRSDALGPERRAELERGVVTTLVATAERERGRVSWPPVPAPFVGRRPMQWCHGAPGMITSLWAFAPGDAQLDALFDAAGETVWQAGPIAKGTGLCHGTAGNGYALLALHARTGEARWLERARVFAMHAIGQRVRERRAHGDRGRFSLWTGDVGLALFLRDCARGWSGMPSLDAF